MKISKMTLRTNFCSHTQGREATGADFGFRNVVCANILVRNGDWGRRRGFRFHVRAETALAGGLGDGVPLCGRSGLVVAFVCGRVSGRVRGRVCGRVCGRAHGVCCGRIPKFLRASSLHLCGKVRLCAG